MKKRKICTIEITASAETKKREKRSVTRRCPQDREILKVTKERSWVIKPWNSKSYKEEKIIPGITLTSKEIIIYRNLKFVNVSKHISYKD